MGRLLQAYCKSCHYESRELFIDCGMNYSEDKDFYAPGYCDICNEVETVKLMEDPDTCSICKNILTCYHDEFNNHPIITEPIWEYASVQYLEKKYRCPSCYKNELEFSEDGIWD